MPITSTGCPASTGVSLTAFQVSPSMKSRPPCASIRESAFTVLPSIVSLPARTGLNCARKPAPTTKTKNAAVTTVPGMIQVNEQIVARPGVVEQHHRAEEKRDDAAGGQYAMRGRKNIRDEQRDRQHASIPPRRR